MESVNISFLSSVVEVFYFFIALGMLLILLFFFPMILNLTYRCHGVSRSGVRKVKKPVWKNKYIGKVCQSSGQPCMQ